MDLDDSNDPLALDVQAISRIEQVPLLLDVVCRATGMRFAAVARVTADRWICCSSDDRLGFGLKPGSELELGTTICDQIRRSGVEVVIEHVEQDPLYSGHATPAMYGFQSYISVPIRRQGGEFFGTLCAIDPVPAKLDNASVRGMFSLFADLIAAQLDAQDRLGATEIALMAEQKTAALREQFIAVLGHDLRNPLDAVNMATEVLGKSPERGIALLPLMKRSVQRMAELIDNLMDFARGRLGGDLALEVQPPCVLEAQLGQVIDELRAIWPDREIEARLAVADPVVCDRHRLGQLLSNLLANALKHGARDEAVRIEARTAGGQFELSVANGGKAIPASVLERLFQPYFRAAPDSGTDGLGLGLYIVAQIARTHGGSVGAVSTGQETRFTFRMPLSAG